MYGLAMSISSHIGLWLKAKKDHGLEKRYGSISAKPVYDLISVLLSKNTQ